jgi:hypothetical protein
MCKKLTSQSAVQFQCREGYSLSVELSVTTSTVITATAPSYTNPMAELAGCSVVH